MSYIILGYLALLGLRVTGVVRWSWWVFTLPLLFLVLTVAMMSALVLFVGWPD
jgi:hypothetical protein